MTMTYSKKRGVNALVGALENIDERLTAQEAADGQLPVVLDAVVSVLMETADGTRVQLYAGAADGAHARTASHYNARRDLAYSALQEVGLQAFAPRYVHWWFGAGVLFGGAVVAAVWWVLS